VPKHHVLKEVSLRPCSTVHGKCIGGVVLEADHVVVRHAGHPNRCSLGLGLETTPSTVGWSLLTCS